ncbi:MAG: endonuclease/exonuclease/phosphatase family protein [Nanoarchaeota archaeon]|nr:endonuclease/exonuclease/phosphatase family protein [Nanoarchaeota archaeon]
MSLKILSLNIERENHIPKVIALLEKEKPEVIFLQEIHEPDFEMLKKKFGLNGFFAPMLTYPRQIDGEKISVKQGNALYTTLPLLKTEFFIYFGKETIPPYEKYENNGINRVLTVGSVEKGGIKYNVATTHFTWAGGGGVNEEQRRDVKQLLKLLQLQGELVLCGDFNAPRGGEIFTALNRHLKDNIPAHITTTLDPTLHKAGPLSYVVDYVWSTPQYSVQKVRVIDGVSDHMAIVAEIEKF